jgi:hypothetical protein
VRPLGQLGDGRQPRLVACARWQRQVAVRAVAGLVGEAEEVREPAGARVDVHRADEHVGPLVEDLLRPVAVVRVDVQHGDGAVQPGDERGGGDGSVFR